MHSHVNLGTNVGAPEERIAKDIAAKASVCHPERQVIGSPPCRSRHRNA